MVKFNIYSQIFFSIGMMKNIYTRATQSYVFHSAWLKIFYCGGLWL